MRFDNILLNWSERTLGKSIRTVLPTTSTRQKRTSIDIKGGMVFRNIKAIGHVVLDWIAGRDLGEKKSAFGKRRLFVRSSRRFV